MTFLSPELKEVSPPKIDGNSSPDSPVVLISSCLLGRDCRYDGKIISSEEVQVLTDHLRTVPVCPETELGLNSPRPPIKLWQRRDEKKLLFQPAAQKFWHRKIRVKCLRYLRRNPYLTGMILKSRSPTCGPESCKFYRPGSSQPAGRTSGFLPALAARHKPSLPIIDEKKIKKPKKLYRFLVKLYALHDWQQLLNDFSIAGLQKFQANYKLMLLGFDQQGVDDLGRIVARQKKYSESELQRKYLQKLIDCFSGRLTRGKWKNVILHGFGHITEEISDEDRREFLQMVEEFRQGRNNYHEMQSWLLNRAEKLNNDYLLKQKFLEPFPHDLASDLRSKSTAPDPFIEK